MSSTPKFQVGDIAIVISHPNDNTMVGLKVRIVSRYLAGGVGTNWVYYATGAEYDQRSWAFREDWLAPSSDKLRDYTKLQDYTFEQKHVAGTPGPVREFYDEVEKPEHYTYSAPEYEVRKVISAWGLGYNLGNVVKYVARAGRKGDAVTDLRKAIQYLEFEIERLSNE